MGSMRKGVSHAKRAGKPWPPPGYSLAMGGIDTGPYMSIKVTFGVGIGAVIDVESMDEQADNLKILWRGGSVYNKRPPTPGPKGIKASYIPAVPHLFIALVRRSGWTHPSVYAGIWVGLPGVTLTQRLSRIVAGG